MQDKNVCEPYIGTKHLLEKRAVALMVNNLKSEVAALHQVQISLHHILHQFLWNRMMFWKEAMQIGKSL